MSNWMPVASKGKIGHPKSYQRRYGQDYLLTFRADICGNGVRIDHRLIEPPSASKIVALIAMAGEDTASDIAAQPTVAVNIDWLAFWNLVDVFSEGV